MTRRDPSQAQDPEDLSRILAERQQLDALQFRERLVRERAARMRNREDKARPR